MPINYPDLVLMLNGLGLSFQTRFERTRNIKDLKKVVTWESGRSSRASAWKIVFCVALDDSSGNHDHCGYLGSLQASRDANHESKQASE
jgi:hypothetical protein